MNDKVKKKVDKRFGRCLYVTDEGIPCQEKAANKSGRCPAHDSFERFPAKREDFMSIMTYGLRGSLATEFQKFLNDDSLMELKNEVALLKTLLKYLVTVTNKLQETKPDSTAIISALPQIQSLVKDIAAVVKTCAEIENKLGQYIDVKVFVQVLGEMDRILAEEINDPAALMRTSERLANMQWTPMQSKQQIVDAVAGEDNFELEVPVPGTLAKDPPPTLAEEVFDGPGPKRPSTKG